MADIFDLFKKIETGLSDTGGPVTHIIAGLGNIGAEYADTRHNAGFMALDALAEKHGIAIKTLKFNATVGDGTIGGVRVLLMKPTTYMNNSGVAIAAAASFYKIPPERIIVLHDEISFDVGIMRIRRRGSAGGHNGLKSIIAHLGSEEFPRIKIGVGKKPSPDYDLVSFVLGKFPDEQLKLLRLGHMNICSAAELMLAGKIEEAMSKYSR